MPVASSVARDSSIIDLDTTFLPIGHMRQITCVTALQGGTIAGEVAIGPDHWVYPEHFPGDPIFPGALMIEAAGQLIALYAWARGLRGRPRLVRTSAEFLHAVGPAIPHLDLRAEVRRKQQFLFGRIHISAGSVHVASVEAVLAVLTSV